MAEPELRNGNSRLEYPGEITRNKGWTICKASAGGGAQNARRRIVIGSSRAGKDNDNNKTNMSYL